MESTLSPTLLLAIALAPLLGSIVVGLFGTGFFGRQVTRVGGHGITIALVAFSTIASMYVLYQVVVNDAYFNDTLYTWALIGNVPVEIGFLVDSLTATMMVVVTSVSLMVHIYTIGYMSEDPGYNRFFGYISLFTVVFGLGLFLVTFFTRKDVSELENKTSKK